MAGFTFLWLLVSEGGTGKVTIMKDMINN